MIQDITQRSFSTTKIPTSSLLMQLRPGGLRHHDEDIDLEWESQKSVFWFRYPAPWLQDGRRREYLPKDFHDAFLGLPLLQSLLPKKSEYSTLLPAASLPIKGEISLLNRIEQSKAKNKMDGKWWNGFNAINFILWWTLWGPCLWSMTGVAPPVVCMQFRVAVSGRDDLVSWQREWAKTRGVGRSSSWGHQNVQCRPQCAVIREVLGISTLWLWRKEWMICTFPFVLQ